MSDDIEIENENDGMSAIDILEKIDEMASDMEQPVEISPRDPYHHTDKKEIKERSKMWAVLGNSFSPCEKAIDELIPGQYVIRYDDREGIVFVKKPVNLDQLIMLPDSASEEVLQHIEDFWNKEDQFREYGFLWKRGVMLYGPPGSGKTSTLQFVSKMLIDRGGIAIYGNDPRLDAEGLELLRRIEPNRPIVMMIEDIDAVTKHYGEDKLLALLDGELQVDNIIFIATTNYPESLDKRLVNRPSRFDIVKEIGMPSSAARSLFLQLKNSRLKLGENADELKQWVDGSKDFSIAHLKELISLVEIFDVPLNKALTRLQKMNNANPSSEDSGRSIGFSSNM